MSIHNRGADPKSEYPVLLGDSLLAARASGWFSGTLKPRVLHGVSGAALLTAAGSLATSTLRNH